jgi:hydroxyacylglutathione hydrolase
MPATVTPIPLGIVSAFLVQGRKSLLVDAGSAGSGRRILAALRARGVEPRKLSLVLVTHGHADHFGGLSELLPEIRCPVAVHAADAQWVRTGVNGPATPVGALMRLLMAVGRSAGARPVPGVEPGLLVSGGLDLRPYGIEGTVEETPGHTAGSLTLFLDGGDVIVGDLLRGSLLARSRPRWPFVADDLKEVRRSVARVLDRAPRRIWTSHGGPLAPDDIRAFLRSPGGTP